MLRTQSKISTSGEDKSLICQIHREDEYGHDDRIIAADTTARGKKTKISLVDDEEKSIPCLLTPN